MSSNILLIFIVGFVITCQVQPFVTNSIKKSGIFIRCDYERQHQNILLSTPTPDDTTKPSPAGEDEESVMSFDSATKALREKEEQESLERSGNLVSEEQSAKFEAKKSEYEALRDRIRSRASDLDISKSITTREVIQKANEQALSGEKPMLDLSKFEADDDEELSDEEKKEIDEVGEMNFLQQSIEELKLVKWPSLGSTLRLTGIMLVLFVVTATYILFLDSTLRTLVTNAGFIPKPDEVFDFSDLELPEGWTELMTDEDVVGM